MPALHERYIGLFDRGYGREAIEIKLDYPFYGSGILTPPTLDIQVDLGLGHPKYMQVTCVYCTTQQQASRDLEIKQQDLSDCLQRHRDVQKRLGRA